MCPWGRRAEMTDIKRALEQARKLKADQKTDKLSWYEPYEKQLQFFALGGQFRERAMFAGNQVGKTTALCFEVACHLTGRYPDWWPETAKRFHDAVEFIVAGKTAQSTRDILQARLLGPAGSAANLGTGMIPKDCIIVESKVASHGAGGGIDFIEIRHASGSASRIFFRTYQQGRDLFEGLTLTGGCLFDEEPGEDVYDEALIRIAATDGFMAITFTPLKGRTVICKRFLDQASPDRVHVRMTLDDARHIPPERREQIKRACLPYLYPARIEGIPGSGEDAVFPVDLESLKWDAPPLAELPRHWYYLWGIDPGIGHPFAAVLVGHDRDADAYYIVKALRVPGQTPLQHAHAMKQIASNVRVAWPKDAGNREKSSGAALIESYKEHGLDVLPVHATNVDGGVGLEPGLMTMWQAMTTGRFFVNKELTAWFEEARDYHRDENGNVVAKDDDLMSATRYAIMMVQRYGVQVIPGSGGSWRRRRELDNMLANTPSAIAERRGDNHDIFTGERIAPAPVPLGRNMLPEVTIKNGVPVGEPQIAQGVDDDPFDW